METIISSVVALCMFVAGELQEHRIQDKMSDCLRVKREAERNLAINRANVIRYECGKVKAELRPDSEGNLKIYKIIEDKY